MTPRDEAGLNSTYETLASKELQQGTRKKTGYFVKSTKRSNWKRFNVSFKKKSLGRSDPRKI